MRVKKLICIVACVVALCLLFGCDTQQDDKGSLTLPYETKNGDVDTSTQAPTDAEVWKTLCMSYVQKGEKTVAVKIIKDALLTNEEATDSLRNMLLDIWWEVLMYPCAQEESLTLDELSQLRDYTEDVLSFLLPFYYCEDISYERQIYAIDNFFMSNTHPVDGVDPVFVYEQWYAVEAIEEEAIIISGEVVDRFFNDVYN